MARRVLRTIFTFLGIAVFVSIAGMLALYLLLGRGPSVPSNATLVLRFGGDLAETDPPDVFGVPTSARTPTVRGIVDSLRKAKVDRRIAGVL